MYQKQKNRAISNEDENTTTTCTTRCTRQQHISEFYVGSFILKLLWYVKKKKINRAIFHKHENTPTNYTTRSTHPHAPPPPTHHPPTKPLQQYSSMYGGIPVRDEHLVDSGALRTRSTVRNADGGHGFTTPCHLVDRERAATHQAPTTNPPTNAPPQQYNSSAAVHTDQFTSAAQQCGSTRPSGTPAVRQKLDGSGNFLQFSIF